ncbi:caspase domain-containing protein [Trametes meyenii]|nr:caspase domain-containing protein [Trametes meyenii]
MAPVLSKPFRRSSVPPSREAVLRALIIGVNYTQSPEEKRLLHAQKDARAWRELLIDLYKYPPENITMMLDAEESASNLLPTRKNIVREIGKLYQGLQAGDRVVFFYAGHSGQVPTRSRSEDDGYDECLIPMDHKFTMDTRKSSVIILDNYLRQHLVNALPQGVSLTAVFDACHSGTLLDLDHYNCNSVYFPWLSRGPRSASLTKWMYVRRNDARDTGKRSLRVTSLTPEEAACTHSVAQDDKRSNNSVMDHSLLRGRANIRMLGRKDTTLGRTITLEAVGKKSGSPCNMGKKRPFPQRALSHPCTESFLASKKQTLHRRCSFDQKLATLGLKNMAYAFISLLKPRNNSPESYRCVGECKLEPNPKVHIISISACQDGQQTFESRRGRSMTTDLIKLLWEDSHPPCLELVQKLGHRLHARSMKVHDYNAKQREMKKRGELPEDTVILDGVNFMEPQIGSQHRLVRGLKVEQF